MRSQAIIEIKPTEHGEMPSGLLLAAYRESRQGTIVLILNGVAVETVDAILDPLVPTLPLDIPGLLYVDIGDVDGIATLLASSERAFVATPHLRSLLRRAAGEAFVLSMEALDIWFAARLPMPQPRAA